MCDHPFENSIAISQLLPQLISSVRPHSSQADCINPTLSPALRTVTFCCFHLKPQNHHEQRENQHVSSLLVNPNVKLPAVSSADYTAVAALLQQLLAAVVFAGSEIITISPSLRSGEIMHYFCAADYLRLPNFSLTNWYIFRENTQISLNLCCVWFYG